jgi:hypothetical protein
MKIRPMRLRLITGLTLLITLLSGLGAAADSDVTDFGRNRWRTHFTPVEPEFPLSQQAKPVWEVPLGLSRSQPLVVQRDYNGDGRSETRIYHLAGDTLWALNGDHTPRGRASGQSTHAYRARLREEGFILWDRPAELLCGQETFRAVDPLLNLKCSRLKPRREQRPFASSQAAYWKGNRPDQDVIYVGFGHPASVVAFRAIDGKILGGYIIDAGTDRGIVGAPLAFADDTVVIGTTSGEAFIIKGLTTGAATARGFVLGGRISSSPVPFGERGFIMASDARTEPALGTHGYVMGFSLSDGALSEFHPLWPAGVATPRGIPGEVAIDARTVYLADKIGRLYALSLETGELLWCRQYPGLGPCQGYNRASPPHAPAFINSGPGLDEDRVYFVFRNNQGFNQGGGQIVALSKQTGQLEWQRSLSYQGNTAPVPLGNIVIVGDTGGYVQAFEKTTGKEVTYGGYPLRLSDEPYAAGAQGERWWEPIGGTATQMTVSRGLMLLGVNSQTDERTVLKAYRLHEMPDLTLEYLHVPSVSEQSGFTATVRAVCHGCSAWRSTTVGLKINGLELPRKAVSFEGGTYSARILSWNSGPLPAGSTVSLVATIDPDNGVTESNEGNNSRRASTKVTIPANITNTDGWGSKLTD